MKAPTRWYIASDTILDGSLVDQLTDMSGNADHFTPTTDKFSYVSGALQGRPSISADGTKNMFLASTLNLGTQHTIVAVRKKSFSPMIVSSSGGGNYWGLDNYYSASGNYVEIPFTNPGTIWGCEMIKRDAVGLTRYWNNVESGVVAYANSSVLYIDRFGYSSYLFNGELVELIIYDSALTDEERDEVYDYIYQKYFSLFSMSQTAWNDGDSKYELAEETPGIYYEDGNIIFNPTALLNYRYQTNINWTEVTDADTTIEVYTAITNDGDTAPTTEWELQAKDDVINGFESEIPSGMYLWVKVEFATDDTSKTPQISIPVITLDIIAPTLINISTTYGDKAETDTPLLKNISTQKGDKNQLPKIMNILTQKGDRNQLPKIMNFYVQHECSDYVIEGDVPLFNFAGF